MDDMSRYSNMMQDRVMDYMPGLVMAIITLVIGLWLIGYFSSGLKSVFERSGMEGTLRNFLLSLVNIGLKVLLIISVASMVGIETTSFIAVLGAAGLAIGFALQGALANFAGGVLILIFRPYKIGDFIEAAGHSGSVRSIEIFSTVMTSSDNKTIIIPNGAISNSPIINYSTQETRRVDLVFSIGYADDLRKAKGVLENLISSDERILKTPVPTIVVSNLGHSSVDIRTQSWVKADDYGGVRYDLLENVKLAFDENDISIPYPRSDVHLYNEPRNLD
jgi:small conductance mechanosensitive channel